MNMIFVNLKKGKTLALAAVLFFCFCVVGMVFSWDDPESPPPTDNASTPLNVSSTNQNKLGDLSIGSGTSYWISKNGDSFVLKNGSGTTNLIIGQDGNVGIGTAIPGAKLDVNGQIQIRGGSPGAGKVLTSGASGLATWESPAGGLPAGTSGQTLRHDGSSWTANSVLYNNGTNIGISTTTPSELLHVGTNSGTINRYIQVQSPGSYNAGIKMMAGSANNWFIENNEADSISGMVFGMDSNKYVTINSSGNVGIGTTNPGAKLDVNGAIRSNNEIVGTILGGPGQFRAIHGNYGAFIRNDGANTYLLLTNSGDTYGSWNSLRPFYVGNSTGNVSLGNSTLYVVHNSSVGIGTTSPWAKLTVTGGKAAFTRDGVAECCGNDATITLGENTATTGKKASISFHNSGVAEGTIELASSGERRIILRDNQSVLMGLEASGNIRGLAFYYTSDASLKENFKPLSSDADKILDLEGKYFTWKENGQASLGVIAQDVEKLFPELVSEDSENGIKRVDYGRLIVPVLEVVKKQNERISDLESRIKELETKFDQIK